MRAHALLAAVSALLTFSTAVSAQPRLRDIPRAGTGLEVDNPYHIPVIFSVVGFDRAEGNRLRTELELAVTEVVESLGGVRMISSPLPYRVHVNVRLDRSRRAFTTVSFERNVTYRAGRGDAERAYEAPAVMTYSTLDRPYTQSGVLLDAERLSRDVVASLVPLSE
jgi:hypothetical protein